MLITKRGLQQILDGMPDKIEVEEVFDKILLSAKIELALEESKQGLGEDFEDFKTAWLKEN